MPRDLRDSCKFDPFGRKDCSPGGRSRGSVEMLGGTVASRFVVAAGTSTTQDPGGRCCRVDQSGWTLLSIHVVWFSQHRYVLVGVQPSSWCPSVSIGPDPPRHRNGLWREIYEVRKNRVNAAAVGKCAIGVPIFGWLRAGPRTLWQEDRHVTAAAATIREGADELTLRADEVGTQRPFINTEHTDFGRWVPPLVDADWRSFCQAVYKGIEWK